MKHEDQSPQAQAGPLEGVVLPRFTPLTVAVRDEQLVIRIGVGVLASAARGADWWDQTARIVDEDAYAREVARLLDMYEEGELCPAAELLDAMMRDAMNDGCDGLEFED